MIVDNFLLPRFLILELLCACHWFEYTKAVDVLTCEARETGAKKGIYELREILNSDNKVSYKFSAVKQGAQGLKEFQTTTHRTALTAAYQERHTQHTAS